MYTQTDNYIYLPYINTYIYIYIYLSCYSNWKSLPIPLNPQPSSNLPQAQMMASLASPSKSLSSSSFPEQRGM